MSCEDCGEQVADDRFLLAYYLAFVLELTPICARCAWRRMNYGKDVPMPEKSRSLW